LSGLTFLNTREADAARELTERLQALGAEVMECPMLAFAPPESWAPFDSSVAGLRAEDWVAFTSATAVRFTLERLSALGKPMEVLAGAHLAAVGGATAAALEALGLAVELVPEKFQAEDLLGALLDRVPSGGRVWLPRAESAREVLVEGLENAGLRVEVTPVYRTVMPPEGLGRAEGALQSGGLDWIIFTSSSTVNHLIRLLSEAGARPLADTGVNIACLGSVTAETARQHGLRVSVQPGRQDLEGLVAALEAHVSGGRE
jgi:uroporphyrinogen-III synthase